MSFAKLQLPMIARFSVFSSIEQTNPRLIMKYGNPIRQLVLLSFQCANQHFDNSLLTLWSICCDIFIWQIGRQQQQEHSELSALWDMSEHWSFLLNHRYPLKLRVLLCLLLKIGLFLPDTLYWKWHIQCPSVLSFVVHHLSPHGILSLPSTSNWVAECC